jgi:hypothetical protein
LKVRISLLAARQRDSSGAAGLIDYALSYGIVHVADLSMTSRIYSKTVTLGPVVELTGNVGAATRVWYIRNLLGVCGPAYLIILMASVP